MECGTIWADKAAPRGLEAAIGYEELPIAIMKKTSKKSTNRRQPSKVNLIEGCHVIKSKIDEQWN